MTGRRAIGWLTLAITVTAALTSCSPVAPSSADGVPPASVPPATVPTVMPGVASCPAPAVEGGSFTGEIVAAWSIGGPGPDDSEGIASLCVGTAGGLHASVDVTCTWSVDRQQVLEVRTDTVVTGDVSVFGTWSRRPPQTSESWLLRVTPAGEAAYHSVGAGASARLDGDGQTGRLDAVGGVQDLGTGPLPPVFPGTDPVAPLPYTLAWACRQPPPPVPGVGAGTINVHFGSPIDRSVDLPARCSWDQPVGGAAVVTSVDAAGWTVAPGLVMEAGIGLDALDRIGGEPADVRLSVSQDDLITSRRFSSFGGAEALYPLRGSPDGARGSMRFREMRAEDLGGPTDVEVSAFPVDVISGTMGWTCDVPAAAPEPAEAHDVIAVRAVPGSLHLAFERPLARLVMGAPATCLIDGSGDDLSIRRIHGQLPDEDGGSVVVEVGRTLRLARFDETGTFIGEYEGPVTQSGDVRAGPVRVFVAAFPVGDDPAFRPYEADGSVVKPVGIFVEYACEVGAAGG